MESKHTIEIYVNGELQENEKLELKYINKILKEFRYSLAEQKAKEKQYCKYEGIYIFSPATSLENLEIDIQKLKDNMEKCENIEKIGLKQLAYDIKGNKKGYYIKFDYTANNKQLFNIEKIARINDNVIKFLNIKMED